MAYNYLPEITQASAPRFQNTRFKASTYIRGALEITEDGDSWFYPERFTSKQRQALVSCLAWHPGLFKQMAHCTSGVVLDFRTAASYLFIEFRLDRYTRQTQSQLEGVACEDVFDGISIEIDHRDFGVVASHELALSDDTCGIQITFDAVDQLPLERHIRVFLPQLSGCALRYIYTDGCEVVSSVSCEQLLVLGDSIGQGFVCGSPSNNWCSLLAQRLNLDLYNQCVGGQVFQETSLADLDRKICPQQIVVQLGANYRFEPCSASLVQREIKAYLKRLNILFPKASVWVISPFWHIESRYPTHPKSCYGEVSGMLQVLVSEYSRTTYVDGYDLLEQDPSLFVDSVHPNRKGAAMIAERLLAKVAFATELSTFEAQVQDNLLQLDDKAVSIGSCDAISSRCEEESLGSMVEEVEILSLDCADAVDNTDVSAEGSFDTEVFEESCAADIFTDDSVDSVLSGKTAVTDKGISDAQEACNGPSDPQGELILFSVDTRDNGDLEAKTSEKELPQSSSCVKRRSVHRSSRRTKRQTSHLEQLQLFNLEDL